MTFTRQSDSSTLNPVAVVGPFRQARTTNNTVRQLAQSTDVRVVYGQTGPRKGAFTLRFTSYTTADAAIAWFCHQSLYEFDGTPNNQGDYTIVDDYIVETGDADAGAYAITFAVTDASEPELVRGNAGYWDVVISYTEVDS